MRHEVTTRRVLYEIPGMRSIRAADHAFRGADGQPLPLSVYEPPKPVSTPPPAVILLEGYPDPGFEQRVGCRFMDMEWTISMAQLIAASGLVAITHSNRDPRADAAALIQHVTTRGGEFGVDGTRIALWATSGHAPVTVQMLPHVACAVLSNPFLPAEYATLGAKHRPLFIIRSGKDETPGINTTLDAFIHSAIDANQPVTVVNLPEAPHSFDLFYDTPITRHVLQQALRFLRVYLAL